MKYEMLLTTPDDVEYMSEKLDAFYDSIVPPSERPSTEGYVLKVSDENGNIIGGCIWRESAFGNDLPADGCPWSGNGSEYPCPA